MHALLRSTRFRHALLLLLVAATTHHLRGSSVATPTELEFEHITAADGLPANTVYWITQDSLGFLWFSTWNGLARYDGYTFKQFVPEPDNPNSVSDRYLVEILPDRQGYLWIGTMNSGLDRFDPRTETFTNYRHSETDPNSLCNDGVWTLYEDSKGVIWIGTNGGGLDALDSNTGVFTHYANDPDDPNSLSDNRVYAIREDRQGTLWVGTHRGLNRLDRDTGKFVRYLPDRRNPNSLSHYLITSIYEDRDGILWIGTTGGGINRYDPGKGAFEHYKHDPDDPTSLSDNGVFCFLEDHEGTFWIATTGGGINILDRETGIFSRYRSDPNDPTTPSSDYVRYMFEDRSGVVWFAYTYTGLSRVNRYAHKFRHFRHIPTDPNSLNNNWVWSLLEDREGALWVGTDGGGLNRYDPDTGKYHTYRHIPGDPKSLGHNVVRSLYEDKSGTLWAGTRGGLSRYDRGTETFRTYTSSRGDSTSLGASHVTAICEDKFGVLWVGTGGGGLNRFDRETETFHRYKHDSDDPQSISGNWVYSLYEDSFGTLWAGTAGWGLNRFDPVTETFTSYVDYSSGLGAVSSIYEDRTGRFWIGCYKAGLHLFDRASGTWQTYTDDDGLPHRSVKAMLEDDAGRLWLSTDNGLSRFDSEAGTFRNYSQADGLQSNLFNLGAACRGRNGDLYFGGVYGFNAFHPDELQDNDYPPQVVFSDLKLFNKSLEVTPESPLEAHVSVAQDVNLGYWQNDITIEYAALHYGNPKKNSYAYKLENYDVEWRNVGTERRATYTSLDPGTYVFKVRAANGDGVWSTEPASLNIAINPAFWQTWWFNGLSIFAVLALGVLAYRKRVQTMEVRRRQLEAQVNEKAQAAGALQDALGEVELLKNRLQAENIYLQDEIRLAHNFENIITRSECFKKILQSVEQVATTEASVLILGESGTGKELLARAVHSISARSERPLVKVNCSALPANLIESELFGHEKGAFTGAVSRKIGRFELADGGTIFLDEIGDLPHELQAKLLRVLQEGEFERLGNPNTLTVNVRVIAATNRELEKEMAAGRFREDLFYRLNVFPIVLPPLRDRKDDIPLLVRHFAKKSAAAVGKLVDTVPQSAVDALMAYHWPGNCRELENVIERAVILSPGSKLVLGDWLSRNGGNGGDGDTSTSGAISTLEENERSHILRALESTNWRVSGEQGAAKMLSINPKTLESRMRKLNLRRPKEDTVS
jgi:transcriptional regulator with GAF, ATPase, and Fis domain/ligand-binding sensor domain-containing protein